MMTTGNDDTDGDDYRASSSMQKFNLAQMNSIAGSYDVAMARARRFFLDTGNVEGNIPVTILQSWRRSADYGVAMDAPAKVEIPTRAELSALIERNESLVQASWGEVEALRRDIGQSEGVVILTDPEGQILMRVGNDSFMQAANRLALMPGASWNERLMGTNAIGTAIQESSPLSICGTEHFLDPNGVLSCSAIPILNPQGSILGTLDLSTPANIPHDHLLALLGRAVTHIERNIFQYNSDSWERMVIHSNPSLLGSPHEGVLAFDGDRLVGANRIAMTLLGLPWSAIGGLRFNDLFSVQHGSVNRTASSDECIVQTLNGQTFFARMVQAKPERRRQSVSHEPLRQHRKVTDVPRQPYEILDDLQKDRIVGPISRRKPATGAMLAASDERDDSGEAVLIVVKGEVRCFTSFEGKELTLFALGPGDAMILRDHLQMEMRSEGEVYILRHKEFETALGMSTEFALSVIPVVEHLLRKSIELIEDMVFHSVKFRLVRMVVDRAEKSGRPTARGISVQMQSNGEEIAMRLGVTRQTVSTAIAGLIRDGYVERLGSKEFLVRDLGKLKALLDKK
ncbi:GAF domain-containing protein [uncultured Cohaesibacter sp.]|uniref:GAF domain-containing protein n=1 Tax=uncultured Cohaesibacter sp. TaxID=1002546 RepID=UPI0029C8F89E|nr:GAF domain-containing protein [uncultured Cohaesibacter sp.]